MSGKRDPTPCQTLGKTSFSFIGEIATVPADSCHAAGLAYSACRKAGRKKETAYWSSGWAAANSKRKVFGTSDQRLMIINGSDVRPNTFFVSHAAAASPADSFAVQGIITHP